MVVRDYLNEGSDYPLDDFIERSCTALNIGSDRVRAKFSFPCSLALGQIQRIEARAAQYQQLPEPKVRLLRFIE